MMACLWCYLAPIKKQQQKNFVKVEPTPAKLSGSTHVKASNMTAANKKDHIYQSVSFIAYNQCCVMKKRDLFGP